MSLAGPASAKAPGHRRRGDSQSNEPPAEEGGESAFARKEAMRYLKRGGKPTNAAVVGLHQGLADPQLARKVIAAGHAGAPLAVNVPTDGKTLRQVVGDPKFEWTPQKADQFGASDKNRDADPSCPNPDADRAARQQLRLEALRAMHAALEAAFCVLDKLLPDTIAYIAFKLVRRNVMLDVQTALLEVGNILSKPCADLERSSRRVEQAQLWLFLLPGYAGLAAIVRAAEADRMPVQVTWSATKEADGYAAAFSKILDGDPASLAQVRAVAPSAITHTRALIQELEASIRKGQKALGKVKSVEQVADVPLSLASGATLGPEILVINLVVDAIGFTIAHQAAIETLMQGAPGFYREYFYLKQNSPVLYEHVLRPNLKELGLDMLTSFEPKDLAFIVGRTIRFVLAHDGAGSLAFVFACFAACTLLVSLIDSPVLAAHGIGEIVEKDEGDAEKILRDPDKRAKFAQALGKELPPEELQALIEELYRNRAHVKGLVAAGETMAPPLAAIVADIQAEGKATQAQAKLMLSDLQLPLLDPAP